MKHKPLFPGIGWAACLLVLILDGKTALEGARQGVALCIATVIPSLFPFFVLSMLLTGSLMGTALPILRPLGRMLGIPQGGEVLLVSGFLGGYPAGAQTIRESYRQGHLSRETAEHLLPWCNQPGPAFLFGMMTGFFPRGWMVWLLWGIVVLSALLAAQCFPRETASAVRIVTVGVRSPADAMAAALHAMAMVCGWVVVFRVVLAFLSRWFLWMLPTEAQVAVTGALELTNGCVRLGSISDLRLRFCLAAGMLTLGGGCVTLQTLSLIRELSPGRYLLGKLVQALIALTLATAICYGWWLPAGALLLLLAVIRQKRGSIPGAIGV